MLNDHLENQLTQQKQETADLQEINQKLQEENDKVVKEKADMLIMLAKKVNLFKVLFYLEALFIYSSKITVGWPNGIIVL